MAVARRLFAERGFAGTSTEDVVTAAGVTRGALYYHFKDKQDLFRAVFTEVEEELNEQVTAAAMAAGDPWPALLAGCEAYLAATLDPAVQRITLIDAPAVLGWDAWREIGSQHRFGLLALGLHAAMAAGDIEDQPVAPLTRVLLGALNEGAVLVGQGRSFYEVAAVVRRLLEGLRTG